MVLLIAILLAATFASKASLVQNMARPDSLKSLRSNLIECNQPILDGILKLRENVPKSSCQSKRNRYLIGHFSLTNSWQLNTTDRLAVVET